MSEKSRSLKLAFTSTPMILVYVMVAFCLAAAIRQPAFLSPATLINLSRAGIFTMCFAICEMVVIISGGIDVSFPAVGCVAMYVPMYLYYNDMGCDSVLFFFGIAENIAFDKYKEEIDNVKKNLIRVDMLKKVEWLKEKREALKLSYRIEIDGGINQDTYKLALDAGCDTLVAGSYVFKNDIAKTIEGMLK